MRIDYTITDLDAVEATDTTATIAGQDLRSALVNTPQLLDDSRTDPFFKDGKAVGLRIFEIKEGSLYDKIGLKNGDILSSTDDNSLAEMSQVIKFFETLRDTKPLTLMIKRGSSDMRIDFTVTYKDPSPLTGAGQVPHKSDTNIGIKFTNIGQSIDITIDSKELQSSLNNLPQLLSESRAVPYFKAGKEVGLRIFAIKEGSLWEKISLKNADILKSINGNRLADITQTIKLFDTLRNEKSLSLVIERGGKEIWLNYTLTSSPP